ncbi:MAG TPA: sulfotransferase [Thermoanaerobaculia bacterium]|jgi:hypothetical protein|nr:sulfotransferase [Thermoanaerobaculia bacterium]
MSSGNASRWGAALRSALGIFSPRRRRWRHFLRSLPLDPAALPRPLPPPGPRDVILCGCPRSGTTLLAAQLFQPPHFLTVTEPWDGMRLPPASLFASLRGEVETTGRLERGKLDAAALLRHGEVAWTREGTATPPLAMAPGWWLGVKWPVYWRYLELLPDTRFVVAVREPQAVIASFRAQGGRLARGLEYDTRFNRVLNDSLRAATKSDAERRALLYERSTGAVLPHLGRAGVLLVRYERWFGDAVGLRRELSAFFDRELAPWPARLQPPAPAPPLDAADHAAIRDCCPSAAALGYPLPT